MLPSTENLRELVEYVSKKYHVPLRQDLLKITFLFGKIINVENKTNRTIGALQKYHNFPEEFPPKSTFFGKIGHLKNTTGNHLWELPIAFVDFKKFTLEHIEKEETLFFPLLYEIEDALGQRRKLQHIFCGVITPLIHQMEIEHAFMEELLKSIQAITGEFLLIQHESSDYTTLVEILEKIKNDTLDHTTFENDVLYKIARKKEALVSS